MGHLREQFQRKEFNTYEYYSISTTRDRVAWSGLDRLSNLRDELDTLFEMPFWSNFGRQSQLFSGWSPALDLYQNNDNVVVRVELPGMRKEDIEISLQDGMLTISGERKSETAESDKAERTERYVGKFRAQHFAADSSRCRAKSRLRIATAFYRHSAQSGGSEAETDSGQRRLIHEELIIMKHIGS